MMATPARSDSCQDGECLGTGTINCNDGDPYCGTCEPEFGCVVEQICSGECGDGTCGANETCSSCAEDCGDARSLCGDGECNPRKAVPRVPPIVGSVPTSAETRTVPMRKVAEAARRTAESVRIPMGAVRPKAGDAALAHASPVSANPTRNVVRLRGRKSVSMRVPSVDSPAKNPAVAMESARETKPAPPARPIVAFALHSAETARATRMNRALPARSIVVRARLFAEMVPAAHRRTAPRVQRTAVLVQRAAGMEPAAHRRAAAHARRIAECAPLLAGTAPATAAKTAHPVRRTAGSALPDVGTTFAVPERPAKPVNPIAGLVPRPAETERALRWNSVKVARRIAEHAHPNVGTRPATTMKPV